MVELADLTCILVCFEAGPVCQPGRNLTHVAKCYERLL